MAPGVSRCGDPPLAAFGKTPSTRKVYVAQALNLASRNLVVGVLELRASGPDLADAKESPHL